MRKKSDTLFYLVAFIEGASVMAVEISGAKLIAPYFGSSLYVWSSVMSITLGGLALGYYNGGYWSNKCNKKSLLVYVLLLASMYIGVMPLLANSMNWFANYFSLIPAVILSTSCLLFPPLFLMGNSSPLIIALLTEKAEQAGTVSGKIYAISTVGGIIATFLTGFYLIPYWGLHYTCLLFSGLLLLTVGLLAWKTKLPNLYVILLIVATTLIVSFSYKKHTKNVYEVDGLLGKLEVIDEPNDKNEPIRKLLINNIVQTEINLSTKQSTSDYTKLIGNQIPKVSNKKALLLGLGGGVVANKLVEKGYKVTAVELDNRIVECAQRFFDLNSSIVVYTDDARHYINTCNTKYDLIILDIFKAEEQPAHVITEESCKKIKSLLQDSAVVVINWHGYTTGNRGNGTRILYNTLKKSGFYVDVISTSEKEDYRNNVFIASLSPITIIDSSLVSLQILPIHQLNKDNQPIIEAYNAEANYSWRTNYLRNYILKK